MPVRRGKDKDGTHYQWGNSGKKYHYETGNEKSREAPEGSPEHQLYRELAAEEHEHSELLATEFARWKAGKAGLLQSDL